MRESLSVLIIEQDWEFARHVEQMLMSGDDRVQEVDAVATVSDAMRMLDRGTYDAALVGLTSADRAGCEVIGKIRSARPVLPVLALLDTDDITLSTEALRAGAQDYLVRTRIEPDVLKTALHYALQRSEIAAEIAYVNAAEEREHELECLERLMPQPESTVTAQLYGVFPLKSSFPGAFEAMVNRYERLLESVVSSDVEVKSDRVAEELRSIADQLGFMLAGPRDLIDLHTSALRLRVCSDNPARAEACAKEGRLMLIELMGYLVLFYRSYYFGFAAPRSHARAGYAPEEGRDES